MSAETKLHLAEKFRQNWQSQNHYVGKNDNRTPQHNVLKHVNRNVPNVPTLVNPSVGLIDDSLTNLNWLQNLNLFTMPLCQTPLSPSPISYYQSPMSQIAPTVNTTNVPARFSHPFFETNGLYAEVAQNLEFMNQEASAHFFKVNNQLRPPFSDINLISMAIYSYNKQKVSFPEICQWIEQTFPYYKIINQEWKVGIKNHLTLSKCFQKVPRKKDEVEKGGFWRFSNDFLNYLEKNQLMARNLNDIVINVQQENANHMQYKYGQILSRKRPISSSPVGNSNTSFKVPNKKANLGNNQIFFELPSSDQLTGQTVVRETTDSIKLKSESTMHQFYNSTPITVTNDTMSRPFEQNKFDINAFHPNANDFNTIAVPCPEQLTEEEFLSGRIFNHYYTTNQSNIENTHALLDSQLNFNSSDFNIHDLSITGIKIRPPEWWEQSLNASQISISRLGYSLRSLTSLSNIERGSPFTEEDHQIIWPADQNLEELDMLFGLG